MAQSWLEKASYISLAVASFVVAGATIYDRVESRRKPVQTESSLIGGSVSIPGVDWSSRSATVVLALSTGCHFCAESAPFYRELSVAVGRNPRIGFVAIFPQSQIQAIKYLQEEQVSVQKVLSLPLTAVKVEGTPTMLLVGKDGTVRQVWVGRLGKDAEASALNAIVSAARGASS